MACHLKFRMNTRHHGLCEGQEVSGREMMLLVPIRLLMTWPPEEPYKPSDGLLTQILSLLTAPRMGASLIHAFKAINQRQTAPKKVPRLRPPKTLEVLGNLRPRGKWAQIDTGRRCKTFFQGRSRLTYRPGSALGRKKSSVALVLRIHEPP